MKQKLMSVILTVVMVAVLFAGCGKKEAEQPAEQPAADGTAATTEPAAGEEAKEPVEITKIHIAMFNFGERKDAGLIQEEINKISREKIGVEAEITFIGIGSWQQQTNLMLSSGEPLDLFPTIRTPLGTYVSNGQVIALDDLLDQYGQGIKDNLAQNYIDCGRVNNTLYGLTTNRDLAASFGFTMRKDIADKYNIDYENIKTFDELEKALLIIKENEPEMYPVVPQNGAMVLHNGWGVDQLSDSNLLGVLLNSGDNLDVTNIYESDYYTNMVTTMRKWYEEGLIMPDTLNNTEASSALIKSGKGFGYFSNQKPGFAEQETRNTGIEMVSIELVPAFATTSNAQGIVWCIPVNSQTPDKAMQFLNLMFSDADISNLLIYGIEGTHYQVIDEANGIIDYVDGIDVSSTGYSPNLGWGWPNQFIGHVWNGNPANYWEIMADFNNTAFKSQAIGFTFDATSVSNEIAACTNVVNQYNNALRCGAIDPAEALPKFQQELKDAGIDIIIAEKQKQLDGWAAQQ